MTDAPDFRDTVFLPKTDFPMKAGLSAKEPAILERWARINLYQKLREQRAGRPASSSTMARPTRMATFTWAMR